MNKTATIITISAALLLTGCAPATTEPATITVTTPATQPAPTPTTEPAPTIDVTKTSAYTFDDGLTITYNSATIAAADQIASDPKPGSQPVTITLTYSNGSTTTIPLQPVPLTVHHGTNHTETEQPTLYKGDPTHTDIPQQLTAGTTLKVTDTYWIPEGQPFNVTVNVSGSHDQHRPHPTFTGLSVQ